MQKAVSPPEIVLALSSWTIKETDGQFRITKTGIKQYGRAYKTLRNALLAIARKHEEEYTRRRTRLHGGGHG